MANGYREMAIINPDNLPAQRILLAWEKAIVLPSKAIVLYGDNPIKNHIPHIEIDGKEHKLCCSCHKWLRLYEFYKSNGNKDEYMAKCADCQRAYCRKLYKDGKYPSYYKKNQAEGGR